MTTEAVIPHSTEAEAAVVGSVLIAPELMNDLHFLADEDFHIHRNRFIWQALTRLHKRNSVIDLLTVSEELEQMNLLAEIGGSAYVTSLINSVPFSGNAEEYARIIEAHSVRRKLLVVANKIASLAYNTDVTAQEAKSLADNELLAINTVSESEDPGKAFVKAISKVYDRAALNAELIQKGLPIVTGIKTGLKDLDALLLGLENEESVIVAGRPGTGKTSFLFDIARHNVLKENKNVAVFSLEMSDEEVARRFISQDSEVDSTKIKTGLLSEAEWRRINKSVEKYENGGRIFLFDVSGLTPAQLRAKCLMVKRQYGLDLVLLDYIGLMSAGIKTENRTREIGEISRRIKVLVKELKCPIITAAQMSREIEKRTDKRPVLADLRDSGDLEQDANCVIFLHVDDNGGTKAIVAKRRDGSLGDVPLVYRKEFTTFRSARMEKFNPNDEHRAIYASHSAVGSED